MSRKAKLDAGVSLADLLASIGSPSPDQVLMDTPTRIIDAARELFLEKGYNSTSVADILARSQVNSGSLYHFFPSKQDVLIAVLISYRDNIGQWLFEPCWKGIDDPIER